MNEHIKYSSYSTLELIKRISINKENSALNNFLSSRKLLFINSKRLLLPDYLQKLKEKRFYPFITIPNDETKLEEKLNLTYDRTLQKFTVLKINKDKLEGPFCDKQYETLYKQITNNKDLSYTQSQLEQELEIESLFKKMVIRHLKFSWLEVCRQTNRLYQRYRWEVDGGTIELKKPLRIDGREFTKWLSTHIDNPKSCAKDEKHRIQKEVDDWFGKSIEIDYSKIKNIQSGNLDPITETERYSEDFTTLIADEKSRNLIKLRPAIRDLGADNVKELVKKIVDDHIYEKNNDVSNVREFGISKATYSRFAGRNWEQDNNGKVPDLWKNIAEVVANDPVFYEIAISIGIKAIIDKIKTSK